MFECSRQNKKNSENKTTFFNLQRLLSTMIVIALIFFHAYFFPNKPHTRKSKPASFSWFTARTIIKNIFLQRWNDHFIITVVNAQKQNTGAWAKYHSDKLRGFTPIRMCVIITFIICGQQFLRNYCFQSRKRSSTFVVSSSKPSPPTISIDFFLSSKSQAYDL